MRDLDETTITDAVLASIGGTADARTKEVLSALVRHLHDLVREVRLTHEEWQAAIGYLFRAGQISTPERNEFILTSDILGVSSLVDMVNDQSGPGATESSVLGPFYLPDQTFVGIGADIKGDNEGEALAVSGQVTSTAGGAIEGAVLDFWQTAANALYDVADPDQENGNLRGRMKTDAQGRFEFLTVRPVSYPIPNDGPVGDILRATGRHTMRPAHLHFIVTAPGHRSLITEVFPEDDPYIDEDAVFGVRTSLAVPFAGAGPGNAQRLRFDFCLDPVPG